MTYETGSNEDIRNDKIGMLPHSEFPGNMSWQRPHKKETSIVIRFRWPA